MHFFLIFILYKEQQIGCVNKGKLKGLRDLINLISMVYFLLFLNPNTPKTQNSHIHFTRPLIAAFSRMKNPSKVALISSVTDCTSVKVIQRATTAEQQQQQKKSRITSLLHPKAAETMEMDVCWVYEATFAVSPQTKPCL